MPSTYTSITLGGVEIRPAPFISVSQQSEFKEDGTIKRIIKTIELKGKILAVDPIKNEQEPSGVDDYEIDKKKMTELIRKIGEMEALVTQTIGSLYVTVSPIGPHLSFKVSLKSKNFVINEASMIADYTISLEEVVVDTESVDETWALDPADEYDRFVKITRTRSIQVRSKQLVHNGPVEDYKLAMDKIIVSDSFEDANTYLTFPQNPGYNKTTSYSVNIFKNSVDCTESWVISGNSFTKEETTSSKNSSETIFKSASLSGTITGYSDQFASKYDNALTAYNAIKGWAIGKTYSIAGVSGKVKSISEGTNKINGVITYSVAVSEGIEEGTERYKTVTSTDTPPIPSLVLIQAVGKLEGPIVQKLDAKKQGTKNVSIEVLYEGGARNIPSVSKYAPASSDFFVEKDDVAYDYGTGKVTRSVTWTYN